MQISISHEMKAGENNKYDMYYKDFKSFVGLGFMIRSNSDSL